MTSSRLTIFGVPREVFLTLGTIAASIAFVMELTLLPLLLNAIQVDLGLSVRDLAWVFNAYAIAVAIAVLSSGFIGDIIDRHKLFSFGLVLFAAGSMLSSLSNDLQGLILSRTLQGLGGGLFSPLVPILLTQANSERSGKILMIWGGLVGIAAASLPIFGGTILTTFGWRAIFLIFTVVSIVGLLLILVGRVKPMTQENRTVPNYRQLLRLRGYWLLLLYIFLTYGCFTYFLFFFPIEWHANGFSSAAVSVFLTCVWLSFAVLSFLLRDRVEGMGLRRSLLYAPAFLALSFAMGATFQDLYGIQVLAAVLAGAGLACSNSPSTHLLLRLAPRDLRAFSTSLDIICARTGSVVTIAALTSATTDNSTLAVAVLCIGAMICCRFFWLDQADAH